LKAKVSISMRRYSGCLCVKNERGEKKRERGGGGGYR
jgi:hypothetical protein